MNQPSKLLNQLLNLKRLAESENDRGYDPFALLEEVAAIVRGMIEEVSKIDAAFKTLYDNPPLFGAAADLLDALEQLVCDCEYNGWDDSKSVEAAHVAIFKATGGAA